MAFVPYHGGFAPTPGISDPLESLMRGYKASQEPQKMRQEALMRELTNQFKYIQNKYAPEQAEAGLNQQLLSNRMANLKYQQEPQRFQSQQEADMFANMLKQAQVEKISREAQEKQNQTPAERLTQFFSGSPNAFKLKLIQDAFGANSKVAKDFEKEKGL